MRLLLALTCTSVFASSASADEPVPAQAPPAADPGPTAEAPEPPPAESPVPPPAAPTVPYTPAPVPAQVDTYPPRPPPDQRLRSARQLRTAGQVVTGVGIGAAVTSLALYGVIQSNCQELGCLAVIGPLVGGVPISATLLISGATMWGVGDHRVRTIQAAPTAYLLDQGAGVGIVGVW